MLQRLLLLASIVFFTPSIIAAQNYAWLSDFIGNLRALIGLSVPVLLGVATLVFVWGAVVFIANADDERARIEGRTKMIWGVLALFVIVSVWGIVAILQQIIGVDNSMETTAPGVEIDGVEGDNSGGGGIGNDNLGGGGIGGGIGNDNLGGGGIGGDNLGGDIPPPPPGLP